MRRAPVVPVVPVSRIRRCAVCQTSYPPEGPVPYACDHHWHEGRMIMTCSSACRATLGLPERKPLT